MNQALRLILLAVRRIVRPGDYLIDESRNYLTDESGNKLIG